MHKIKITLLKNSSYSRNKKKQQNYTHDINNQELFLGFRTATGELYTQEYQTICSSIVMSIVRLTRSLSWLYFFFTARWLPAVAWRNLAVCIACSFVIPLHCLKLAASPTDLSNSNSVYRAMHFSANARSWNRMSSVRPSVCLWRWWFVIT